MTNTTAPPLLLWFDLETTGLDIPNGLDVILEVGWGISDINLKWVISPRSELPTLGHAHLEGEWRLTADSFVREMHDKSKLWEDRLTAATDGKLKHLHRIETEIIHTIDELTDRSTPVMVAGCGVSTFDIPIVKDMMPRLARRITYYAMDLSTVERYLSMVLFGSIRGTSKSAVHRVMDDIQHSHNLATGIREVFRYVEIPRFLSVFPEWGK